MKTILWMDIVIAAFGLYLAIVMFQMHKSGKINSILIADPLQKKCKDVKAYLKGIAPYMYFFSIVSFVVGVIGILGDVKVIHTGRVWSYIELALFLLALVIFTHGLRKQKEVYFD